MCDYSNRDDSDVYDYYLSDEDSTSNDKDSDDCDIYEKIRQTHKTMEYLKNCLAIEKGNLQMERLQSQTMCGYPSVTSLPAYTYPYMNYYDYYNAEWPQTYQTVPLYNNAYYGYQRDYTSTPDVLLYAQFYKGQLEDVERKCNEELSRMQRSICDLRKIKRHWATYEPENSFRTPERYSKETIPERLQLYSSSKSTIPTIYDEEDDI